jgi:endonuclease V
MIQEQNNLAKIVNLFDTFKKINLIAGLDIGFVKNDPVKACVGVVILEYPTLINFKLVNMDIEYIPGFLAFREVPKYQEILKTIPPEFKPDLLMVDGNGILHPRKIGVASHLGVLENLPSIGVAKTFFNFKGIIKINENVFLNNELVGKALKIKSIKEIYISPGHNISLLTSEEIIKNCCIYRIPEPIRLADNGCRKFLNSLKKVSKSLKVS